MSHLSIDTNLLSWYDAHHRKLPWRASPGQTANPYHVWLSEIMLQQTTVPTVIPYFERFIKMWPTIQALATASIDDILLAWQGLGYYSRAHHLHKCAQKLVFVHGGKMPSNKTDLLDLPGIGPYTAAAILCIAFNIPAPAVDGNIIRVVSRLLGDETLLPGLRSIIEQTMDKCVSQDRPGDYIQAMMDLSTAICKPRTPLCDQCPLQNKCVAYNQGLDLSKLPMRPVKAPKPIRETMAFALHNEKDQLLIRQKTAKKGVLQGLWEVPCTDYDHKNASVQIDDPEWCLRACMPDNISVVSLNRLDKGIRHTFTHFHLDVTVCVGTAVSMAPIKRYVWVNFDNIEIYPLSTLMKKVLAAAKKNTA
jgi:A/G-specific adenine glycosylase